MIGRRMFLKVAAIGGATARKAAEAEVAKLTSEGRVYDKPLKMGSSLRWRPHDSEEEKANVRNADRYMKLFGIPKHIEETMREQSKSIYYLDPDIAIKVSWSYSFKILAQQQRNYDRAVERMKNRSALQEVSEGFKKLVGFDWEW